MSTLQSLPTETQTSIWILTLTTHPFPPRIITSTFHPTSNTFTYTASPIATLSLCTVARAVTKQLMAGYEELVPGMLFNPDVDILYVSSPDKQDILPMTPHLPILDLKANLKLVRRLMVDETTYRHRISSHAMVELRELHSLKEVLLLRPRLDFFIRYYLRLTIGAGLLDGKKKPSEIKRYCAKKLQLVDFSASAIPGFKNFKSVDRCPDAFMSPRQDDLIAILIPRSARRFTPGTLPASARPWIGRKLPSLTLLVTSGTARDIRDFVDSLNLPSLTHPTLDSEPPRFRHPPTWSLSDSRYLSILLQADGGEYGEWSDGDEGWEEGGVYRSDGKGGVVISDVSELRREMGEGVGDRGVCFEF